MKTFWLTIILILYAGIAVGQVVAVKTNLLYDATTTINLGAEVGLFPKFTLDMSGNYNPWVFSDNKKLNHWLIQPEVRYWFCEKFNGHFIGLHGHYAYYNVGGIKMFGLKDYRYEGDLYGAGISYGYHHILNKRWSMSFTFGAGFAILDYEKYDCGKCGEFIKDDKKTYVGPTKIGVSLMYTIK